MPRNRKQDAPEETASSSSTSIDKLLKAVELLVSEKTTSKASSERLAPVNVKFESFNDNEELFVNFVNRFENYVNLQSSSKPVSDNRKVALFLNFLGPKTFQLLTNLSAPQQPNSLEYDAIVSVLKKHLQPAPNIIAQQYKFSQRMQREGESISDFVAELKALSIHCNFVCHACEVNTVETHLRTQFVVGIRDPEITQKLLQAVDTLTFQEAVKIALAVESSKKDSSQFKQVTRSTSVNHVQGNQKTNSNSHNRILPGSSRQSEGDKTERPMKPAAPFTSVLQKCGIVRDQCLRCGRPGHRVADCKMHPDVECRKCSKKGHIEKICITSILKEKREVVNAVDHDENAVQVNSVAHQEEAGYDTYFSINGISYNHHNSINQIGDPTEMWQKAQLNLLVEHLTIRFEIDPGSPVSTMPLDMFSKWFPDKKISPIRTTFNNYGGMQIPVKGASLVNVTYENTTKPVPLFIIAENCVKPLLGMEWIRTFKIRIDELIHGNYQINSVSDRNYQSIMSEFPTVFEQRVGKVPNYECKLLLKKGAAPRFLKHRVVPYALRTAVENELEKLENNGIITKIENSQWGTPLVPIVKDVDNVRLCADYRNTVNNQLEDDHFPIPRVEELFSKLQGKVFCIIDLYKAYLHVPVDEASSRILAISTHKGTYAVNRLYFGIKVGPAVWQRTMTNILGDIPGTACYFDDIAIAGNSISECKERLQMVLRKLREHNLHVNQKKCRFFQPCIEYLGYEISEAGIRPVKRKVEAILNAPEPKSKEEVQQLLGLINYYRRFIPDTSAIVQPLNDLLKAHHQFHWSEECQRAFHRIKEELSGSKVQVQYDPDLPLMLATDASPFGLSGVLSHRMPDGSERPIEFASRSLSAAERNYSQLDREATAVYWAVNKFFQYCYGRKFELIVDNRALSFIFNPQKELPALVASRMLRYAHFLSGFDYTIKWKSSKENANADYFSRCPIQVNSVNHIDEERNWLQSQLSWITSETMNAELIARESAQDPELKILIAKIQDGTNENLEYTTEQGVLFRGHRVVIPKSLQKKMLDELHETHPGITKMKELARGYCVWKNIDRDIEQKVQNCKSCSDHRHDPPRAKLHPWERPTEPWARVHVDFAGPFMKHYFMIVVDAYSKWLEVTVFKTAPTSKSTIAALSDIFGRFGLCQVLVSDNGAQFRSFEFREWCKMNGISQRFSAVYHPASNGQAERYVQYVKEKLKAMQGEPGTLIEKVTRMVQRQRITPHTATGKSPSEIIFHRQIRSTLDLIRPPNLPPRATNMHGRFQSGDKVQVRNYNNPTRLWEYGSIIKQLGSVHYLVQLADGRTWRRHVDQMRRSAITTGT